MIHVDLEEIGRREYLLIHLSFPKRSVEYALRALDDLRRLGVESIAFMDVSGRLEPIILGKGYRGFVLRGRIGERDVALKILRTDSTMQSLRREAEATSMANSIGVGPVLLGFTDMVLALELIEGESLEKWLSSLEDDRLDDLRVVMRACFEDARRLDEIGLDHGELSDVRRHVIVRRELEPVIIDFGKASTMRRPSNVTSLFNYFLYGPFSRKIRRMLGVEEPPLDVVRDYKMRLSDECFHHLMKSLNLLER